LTCIKAEPRQRALSSRTTAQYRIIDTNAVENADTGTKSYRVGG
jgi:hypothetical protein